MLQSEFENIVKMTVSPAEFEAINTVYMNGDLNKYEFGALWMQINKSRVAKAKEEAKAREKKEKLNDKLWNIIGKYGWKDYQWKEKTLCHTALTQREKKAVEEANLKLEEYNQYLGITEFKRMSTMLFEIRRYLKAA